MFFPNSLNEFKVKIEKKNNIFYAKKMLIFISAFFKI